MKQLIVIFTFFIALFILSSSAIAQSTPALIGGASIKNGVINLVSNQSVPYSGVSLPIPPGMRLSNLLNLSAIIDVTHTDCKYGSPFFQINLNNGSINRSIYVYLGPAPNFTGCALGWQNTGNLVTNPDLRVYAYEIGDTLYRDTFQHVKALAPNDTITSIILETNLPVEYNYSQNINVRSLSLNDKNYLYNPTISPTPTPVSTRYSLVLTSLCSTSPSSIRSWRVRNVEKFPLYYAWELIGSSQRGSAQIPAFSDLNFNTNTIIGPNTLKIYWSIFNTSKSGVTTRCP